VVISNGCGGCLMPVMDDIFIIGQESSMDRLNDLTLLSRNRHIIATASVPKIAN